MVGDRPPMIDSMFTSARMLARFDLEKLVVVAGGIHDGWWAPMSQIVRPSEAIPAEALERARVEMGDAQYAQAWARGAGMSYDELLAFTLDALRALTA
jgi:hypothetical protein